MGLLLRIAEIQVYYLYFLEEAQIYVLLRSFAFEAMGRPTKNYRKTKKQNENRRVKVMTGDQNDRWSLTATAETQSAYFMLVSERGHSKLFGCFRKVRSLSFRRRIE